jgi:hypothetical protein
MQEELNNFKRNEVWLLVERPKQNIVGTKWVFRNKEDEHVVMTRNIAQLVAKGYSQVKGLEFDETFAPVSRLQSIHILLAYATHHDFKLYQMDVKSAFLNGSIKEEVYVEQPPDFESEEYPNHVYKLHKVLYGLKKAPRAWYEYLRDFLIDNGFRIGKADSLEGWTDIILGVCMCARFQAVSKDCHLRVVKRIMRYLVLRPNLSLWYHKGSYFDLIGYSDVDYAGCKVDRKSTFGTCQFLCWSLVSWSS